jgi:hypothetical protein
MRGRTTNVDLDEDASKLMLIYMMDSIMNVNLEDLI